MITVASNQTYNPSDVSVSRRWRMLEGGDGTGDEVDLDAAEDRPIKWITIIFLPFQFWWQIVVFVVVYIKCIFGPMRAALPFLTCAQFVDHNKYLSTLKMVYVYCCDPVYLIDTFLYIVHRQVVDEALKQEHLPKSGWLILVDIAALIPFYTLFSDNQCEVENIWPNILSFSEMLCMYRVGTLFSLKTTHSYWALWGGYSAMLALVVHAAACLLLLLTAHGLCPHCTIQQHHFDWRQNIPRKNCNESLSNSTLYFHASKLVLTMLVHYLPDRTKEITYTEIFLESILMLIGHLLLILVVMPKLFSENIFRLRRIYSFHPRITRIIEETTRRNPSGSAHLDLENIYKFIWKKHRGVNSQSMTVHLPLYMRLEISLDFTWVLYYHSPTLRRTSMSFKRWLCQHIRIESKLPGEIFFTGKNCYTNIYYIKSGLVQLISTNDDTAPLLSVSGGTLFGDINFFVPPVKRKVIVRCKTYCEVFSISRKHLIMALNRFPGDRKQVLKLARERLQHARDLQACARARPAARTPAPAPAPAGRDTIAWLKRTWWQIAENEHRRKLSRRKANTLDIPTEGEDYHCAKYIGQLVLCKDLNKGTERLFVKKQFPWILTANSRAIFVWNRIVVAMVYFTLFIYPHVLTRIQIGKCSWFIYYSFSVDLVYLADLVVTLTTAAEFQEESHASLINVVYYRFAKFSFLLDVLSTFWVADLITLVYGDNMKELSQFNRLLKTYKLFFSRNYKTWNTKKEPLKRICYVIVLNLLCIGYVVPHLMWVSIVKTDLKHKISYTFFYGAPCASELKSHLKTHSLEGETCLLGHADLGLLEIPISWGIRLFFILLRARRILDHAVNIFLILLFMVLFLYSQMKLIAAFYLKYRDKNKYQNFVRKLENYYKSLRIHPDLMKRLNEYLSCHWKYYSGRDVVHLRLVRDEPSGVAAAWRGKPAERAIAACSAFRAADTRLVRDLARKAEYLVLPRHTVLVMLGVHTDKVMWVIHGVVESEYHNETGETLRTIFPNNMMLSLGSVFLRRLPLRTYTAASEVEILFIKTEEFHSIIQRYPNEEAIFNKCAEEIRVQFDDLFVKYLKKHRIYEKKLKQQIPAENLKTNILKDQVVNKQEEQEKSTESEPKMTKSHIIYQYLDLVRNVQNWTFCKNIKKSEFYNNPESKWTRRWLAFRALTVFINIFIDAIFVTGNNLAGVWVYYLRVACACVAAIDIAYKLRLPYYDERGLVITGFRQCAMHYLTRGFWADLGAQVLNADAMVALLRLDPVSGRVMQAATFLQIYLLTGYFNYLADTPSANFTTLMIVKWHLVAILLVAYVSAGMVHLCVDEQHWRLRRQCWAPERYGLLAGQRLSSSDLKLIVASAVAAAQSALLNTQTESLELTPPADYMLPLALVNGAMMLFWWLVSCYLVGLLMLGHRGHSLFTHGVAQLRGFLREERVEPHLIRKTMDHFQYSRKRTAGVNMNVLVNERMGAIFRQDLNYYFYKRSLQAADTLLRGGGLLERRLAALTSELHLVAGADVARQHCLNEHVFLVHRGQVQISDGPRLLHVLTKGSLFGQLRGGGALRPSRVTASTLSHADLLTITVNDFHKAINDDVRLTIADNPQSEYDFMAVKKVIPEDPYNSIQFILRKSKTIKLPGMKSAVRADESAWYARWLVVAWVVAPLLGAAGTLLSLLSSRDRRRPPAVLAETLRGLDCLHLIHVITDFFTMRLVVDADQLQCVYQYKTARRLKSWRFYFDLMSLLLPMLSFFSHVYFQVGRLLRLHSIFLYYNQFCKDFQKRTTSVVIRVALVALLLHAVACGMVLIFCRAYENSGAKFPPPIDKGISKKFIDIIDFTMWQWVDQRNQSGCPVTVPKHAQAHGGARAGERDVAWYLVPRARAADYLVAIADAIAILTRTNLFLMVTVTMDEILYDLFIHHLLYLVRLWIGSLVIITTYTKFRQMYNFDYNVDTLLKYMKINGISDSLQQAVRRYTSLLWRRSKGNEIPSLAYAAPACLRQDLFSSLYMHHLRAPPLLRAQPDYFLRQLGVRMHKIVVFPGKTVVQKGDVIQTIYFIHEGEVEKWFTNENGESQLASVLTTNMYFGVLPGLLPRRPYTFSYCTRTVVELVYLSLENWSDLLDSYPDIKRNIYAKVTALRKSAPDYTHAIFKTV